MTNQQSMTEHENKKKGIENFILSFEKETNRYPTKEEILDNEVEYNIIHGDPHMSNILIDNYNKIWFILFNI